MPDQHQCRKTAWLAECRAALQLLALPAARTSHSAAACESRPAALPTARRPAVQPATSCPAARASCCLALRQAHRPALQLASRTAPALQPSASRPAALPSTSRPTAPRVAPYCPACHALLPCPPRALPCSLRPSRAALPRSPAPPSRLAATTAAADGGATKSAKSAAGAGGANGSAGGAAGAKGAGPTIDRHCLSWPLSRQLQRLGVDSGSHCLSRMTPPLSSFASGELFPQRCVTSSIEAAALGASESATTLGASESTTALGASESAAALGASESAATPNASESAVALGARVSPTTGPSSAEALHTFTLDSSTSRCFFHGCIALTPLVVAVPVSLADPTGGQVVAQASTVLPCPTVPSGSLSGLHLPTFLTNLVSNAAIQDVWVDTFIRGGQRVAICTCFRTGRHLATFTRRPGSSLYTLTTASAQVAEAGQVAASSQVSASGQLAASCSMHSRLLVSGLPMSLPSLPRSPALPYLPCVEGRKRAAPHSSEFPPTTAPLQTLHMDADVSGVLIPWIRANCRHLRERFSWDFPVLRLHSDLLAEFYRDEGIHQSFTLPASPQQNGIAERRIGLIMEVARTSMIHATSPHFLWPFAVRYLNLWPRVSEPETSPTLWWTGKVGDASVFWVWGTLSLVHDAKVSKLSSRTLRCIFLGFPTDAPPWQFYYLHEHRLFSSQDVTFDESDCFYWLHPHASHPVPLAPLFLVPVPTPVDPLPPQGPAPSAEGGDPTADDTAAARRSPRLETPPGFPPRSSSSPPQPAAVDSGAETTGAEPEGAETEGAGSGGAATGGAGSWGAATGDAGSWGDATGGARSWGATTGGVDSGGTAGAGGTGGTAGGGGGAASAGGTSGAAGAGGAKATSPRGAIGAAGAGPTSPGGTAGAGGATSAGGAGAGGTRGAGAAGPGDARTGGAGAAGAGGAVRAGDATGAAGSEGAGGTTGNGGARAGGIRGAGAAGLGGASTRVAGAVGVGGATGAGGAGGATGAAGTGYARGNIGAGGAGAGGTRGAGDAVPRGACSRGAGAAVPGGARTRGAGAAGAGGTASAGGAGSGGTGGTGGAGAAGPGGARTRGAGATGAGGVAGARGTGGATRAAGTGGARGTAGAAGAGAGGTRGTGGAGAAGAGGVGAAGSAPLPSSTTLTPPLLCSPTNQSPPQLLPGSSLPGAAPHTEVNKSLSERREPETCASTPVRALRVARPCPPSVPRTHGMALRPSSVPQRVVLPEPHASSLLHVPDPESDLARAASPTVTRLLATVVSDPEFESTAAFALVIELVDFAARNRLDYVENLNTESESVCPPSIKGEPALSIDGMRIFRVKRLPGSPPAFKARYVARGFGQRQGVDFFHTFSPTPKMTTLRVLLHVVAYRDYELHSLDFSTAFLQGSLHEIWLRRPLGFTRSFPAGMQWSLRRPVYGLLKGPREWHDTLRTTLAALGFSPSSADPSLFLHTETSLPPFYVLVYVDDSLFATADTEALALVKAELQERHTCTDLGPSTLRLLVLLAIAHSSVYWPLDLSSTFGRVRRAEWFVPRACGLPHYIGHGASAWRTGFNGTHRTLRRFLGRCWLTYLLTDLGERPRSPLVLYVDNKTMLALCHEKRLEHRTKHIALRYFLARELQQHRQLHLSYVASRANTVDVFTKALGSGDHQRFCTALGLCPLCLTCWLLDLLLLYTDMYLYTCLFTLARL
ncbi:unnamed protein product [Closterium sp. NIES-54]